MGAYLNEFLKSVSKIKVLGIWFLFLCPALALGQNTVSGVVTDVSSGETIPGVNIRVKGTSAGTSTDNDGSYSLEVSSLSDTLVFSFVGYKTLTEPINGRTTLNVEMTSQTFTGKEMVVVGYSEKQRGEITGSVADVSGESIQQTSETNITQAIQGKIPGVIVNDRGGAPGVNNANFVIRGKSTLGNSSPLIVIDGVPRDEDAFANLAANDIKSISVLKDASAAIYGARAANGVILVTTKKGQEGRPQITVNSDVGIQTVTSYPKAMTAYQRAKYFNEYYQYDGLQPLWSDEALQHFKAGDMPNVYPNTNWSDIVLADYAPKTHHNISASGGNENIQYYFSGDYLYQDGLFKSGDLNYQQAQVRANVSSQITNDLKAGIDVEARQGKRNEPGNAGGFWQDILYDYPWIKDRWPNGTLGPGMNTGDSPITDSYGDISGYVNNDNYTFNTKLSFTYDMPWLTEGLQLLGYANYDYRQYNGKVFHNIWDAYSYNATSDTYSLVQGHIYATPYSRTLVESRAFAHTQFYHLRLNYDHSFGDNNISAFAAIERSESSLDTLSAYRRGLPSDKKVQLFAGTEEAKDNYGSADVGGRLNYFGSVSYNYASTYMLDFSLRYDGSFNFPKGEQFGLFPAISAGWNITNESFMNSSWLDNLKLRLSWGKMGNDRVPAFQYLTRYQLGGSFDNYYAFGLNPQAYKGFTALNTPNPNITWEKSYKTNVGVDFNIRSGLLSGTVDVFYEKRRDILIPRNASVPDYTAISLPDENIGKVNNSGFELSLDHTNTVGQITYNLGGNMTYHKSEIIFMDEAPNIPDYQKQEGHPLHSWLVYEADGLYRSQSEIDNSPHLPGAQPGDIKYIDINGDGSITGDDMVRKYSSPIPQIQFGINAGMNYKNFGLNLFFQGQAKAKQLTFNAEGQHVTEQYFTRRWTPDNPQEGTFPRAFGRDDIVNVRPSTFWLYDASFIRLKNVQLSYNLPVSLTKNIGISHWQFYVSGRNLLTFDHMLGNWDPERTEGSGFQYPQVKTFVLGTNIQF